MSEGSEGGLEEAFGGLFESERSESEKSEDEKDDLLLSPALPSVSPDSSLSLSPSSSPLIQFSVSRDNLSSEFPLFSQYENPSLVLHILSYLNAVELCRLAGTSRSFYYSTMSPKLWKPLLLSNFMFEENEVILIAETPNSLLPAITIHSDLTTCSASKSYYVKQIKEVQVRINNAKMIKLQNEQEQILERQVKVIECCLDMATIRLYVPLPTTMLFATLLMIGLHVDEVSVSIWVCLSPLLFFFVYSLLVCVLTYVTYRYRFHHSSLIRSLWDNIRGPIYFFYHSIANESSSACAVALTACGLLVIQLIFFGLKTSQSLSQSFHESFHWGLVFFPIWFLFVLYLAIPFMDFSRGNLGPFFAALVILWIPLMILFICLTVKLNRIENHHHRTRSHDDLPISLILMPFWILEGVVMVGCLSVLLHGLYRYRQGFLERDNLHERIGVFALFWSLLSPVVIFQSFLSARDDERDGDEAIGMTRTLSPILFMIAFAMGISFIFATKYRTPYQESRRQREMDAAGTRNLFEV